MQISYNSIGTRALLPSKMIDSFWDIWSWWENPTNSRVKDLLSPDGQYGKVITGTDQILTWEMNGDAGSFSFIVPEVFHENRVILVPPQGINLYRYASGKWRVREIQSALLNISQRNSRPWVDTCLGALIDLKKREAIWPHLVQAWYYEIWEKAGCAVYVHKETEKVQASVEKLLDWRK